MRHPPRNLVNLAKLAGAALMLAAALCPAVAAPSDYRTLQAGPGAASPRQPAGRLRPADAGSPPPRDSSIFSLGTAPESMATSRWLSLNFGDEDRPAPADTVESRVLRLSPAAQPPLRILVPFAPGGRSSHYAELLAQRLPKLLGREVRVEHVAQAGEADYRRFAEDASDATVLLAAVRLPRGGIAGVQTGPPIQDELRSLRPVTLLASQPLVLAIDRERSDALGIRNLDELLAYARKHPGALSVATGADGWTGQLAYGQFRALSGVDVRRKSFDGMYPDSDRITREHAADLLFAPVNGVIVAVRRGQLRVLGTTADPDHPLRFEGQDWPSLASTPSLAGYAAYDRFSLWAPTRSQAASNRALQQAVAQALDAAPVREQLADLQAIGGGGPPEQLLTLEDEERERWLRALSAPTP